MSFATETHQEKAQQEVNQDSLQAGSARSAAEPSPADYAREVHDWGLHILPLRPGKKRPMGVAWQEQSRDENLGLFARTPRAGLGFIPGLTIDPNTGEPVCLVHVDVDGDDAYSWFREQVPQELRDGTVAWRSARLRVSDSRGLAPR